MLGLTLKENIPVVDTIENYYQSAGQSRSIVVATDWCNLGLRRSGTYGHGNASGISLRTVNNNVDLLPMFLTGLASTNAIGFVLKFLKAFNFQTKPGFVRERGLARVSLMCLCGTPRTNSRSIIRRNCRSCLSAYSDDRRGKKSRAFQRFVTFSIA